MKSHGAGWGVRLLVTLVCMLGLSAAHSVTLPQALAMSTGDNDERSAGISQAVLSGDPSLEAFLQALLSDEVKVAGEQVFVLKGDRAISIASGATTALPADAQDVSNNNRIRGEIESAIASLKLLSGDLAARTAAVKQLKERPDDSRLPLIEKAPAGESNNALKAELDLLRSALLIASPDASKRLEAAIALGRSDQGATKNLLMERLQPGTEDDAEVRLALQASLASVSSRLAWGERLGVMFTGLSLGSLLLLVALGLAITYGLMGVINMAHGELMMIGAYATYVVQSLVRAHCPQYFDYYMLLAVPASFLAAALVGAVMERGVIRWLYGRPLETLLATWGISLVLMQSVRTVFGAQNVQVENPAWLSGGLQLMSNLTLPYNRLAIMGFAMLVLLLVALLIARSRLGLFVRGVTQNRPMAACLGVNTARVDTYAFALGSGLAGLAGCALSQVGNVGPDLGQGYIVDSFMVVVLGGVGQLAGTVYAALGLGILNKFLEGWTGAVLAKIMVLVLIVAFIQKRPQGIFAMKGRSAQA